jgi:hypothetical protein
MLYGPGMPSFRVRQSNRIRLDYGKGPRFEVRPQSLRYVGLKHGDLVVSYAHGQ